MLEAYTLVYFKIQLLCALHMCGNARLNRLTYVSVYECHVPRSLSHRDREKLVIVIIITRAVSNSELSE